MNLKRLKQPSFCLNVVPFHECFVKYNGRVRALENPYSSEFSASKRTVKGAQGVEKLEKAFLLGSHEISKSVYC